MFKCARKRFILFLSSILVFILILTGLSREFVNPNYNHIYTVNAASLNSSILFEKTNLGTVYVFNDNLNGTCLLINQNGKTEYTLEIGSKIISAYLRNDKLFLYSYDSANFDSAIIYEINVNDLTISRKQDLNIPCTQINLFECDYNGNIFLTLQNNKSTIMKQSFDNNFLGEIYFNYDIDFMQLLDDKLYVYLADGNFGVSSNAAFSSFNFIDDSPIPSKILNSNLFIDIEGNLIDYSNNSLSTIFSCDVPTSNLLFHNLISLEEFIWVQDKNNFNSYNFNTDEEKNFAIDGEICALNSNSAIIRQNKDLFIVYLNSFEEIIIPTPNPTQEPDNSPSPNPSQSPTTSPKPTPKPTTKPTIKPTIEPTPVPEFSLPDWAVEKGDYLYVPIGKTIKNLKTDISPHTVSIGRESGEIMTSGNLRTGWQVTVPTGKTYSIVILGDCNGTGTINSADMKEMQKMILGISTLSEVYFVAADLDEDGEITATDLVLLSILINENSK